MNLLAIRWFPDGLLNDIPSDRFLAFIYEDSGTLTWVMLQKSVIEGNHNWSTYSVPTGQGSISSIGRYNDQQTTGSQSPIATTTTNVQNSSHFIYREESSSTWHSTPPANRRYYVLEEVIQTEYTISFPTPRLCDILIVAGGGAGGVDNGGGGGGGGVLYATGIELNGTYTIKVGNGGQSAAPINPDAYNPTNSGNGYGSEFGKTDDILIVKGGGYGGNAGSSGQLQQMEEMGVVVGVFIQVEVVEVKHCLHIIHLLHQVIRLIIQVMVEMVYYQVLI